MSAIGINLPAALVFFAACLQSALAGAPPIPINLAATAALESHVSLSWTAANGATSYNVYRGNVAGGESLLRSGIPGNTFEDSGLGDGQAYFYKVTAVNAGGESGKSGEVSAITKPPPPTNLNAAAGDSQVVLTWAAAPAATGYQVYRDTLGGAGGATNFLVVGTGVTDTGLVNGTTYFYEIGSVNTNGENHNTGLTVSATPRANNSSEAPAGAPGNLTAKAGNGIVLLNWLPVSNASSYDVFRGDNTNTETLWKAGVVTTSYSDIGLTNRVTHFYKVRAVNAGQASVLSGEVSATPHVPLAPTNLIAQAGNRQIVLTWTGDGTSYAIYRGIAPGTGTLLDSGLTGNTFTDAGVVNGTPYFYQIQCLNAGGSSQLSAEVSATPSGPAPQPWSGTVQFGLPGEPMQSCAVSIADINRPVQLALLTAEGPNMQALAAKYNAITFALDGFTPFNFGTFGSPINLSTTDDSHLVCIMDYRWPELSAQRIQAALTAAAQLVPSHPEIQNTGLILYGFSEGVDNINLAIAQPLLVNRVLAAVHLSEIDEDRDNPLVTMDSAPHLFLASGLGDVYSSLNLGLENFPSVTHDAFSRGLATEQGAPLTVLNNAGAGHGGNPDHPFISIWLDAVLSQRLPAVLPVSAPVNLPSWQNCSSWVGSYDVTLNNASPWNSGVQLINNVVAAKSAYTDPRPFTWLPGQNTSTAWLTYANSGNLATSFNPAITSPATSVATVGKLFNYMITAINYPTSYGATGLPASLSVNPATGIISGTPTVSGTFPVTLSATNSSGSGTATLAFTALAPFSIRNFSFKPADGSLTMVYDTSPGLGYRIQASTNLLGGWITVSNLTATANATTNTISALLLDSLFGSAQLPETFIRVSQP